MIRVVGGVLERIAGNRSLCEVREDIDKIDLEAGPLLGDYFTLNNSAERGFVVLGLNILMASRMKLTEEVGRIKTETGTPPVQSDRYQQVMAVYENHANQYAPSVPVEIFRFIFELIHEASVAQQERIAKHQDQQLSEIP